MVDAAEQRIRWEEDRAGYSDSEPGVLYYGLNPDSVYDYMKEEGHLW